MREGGNETWEVKAEAERPWLWQKGQSGNPAGRPKGAKNQATVWAERFAAAASEEEAATLMRFLVERALANETWALRYFLTRVLAPAKHRPIVFELPAATGLGPNADAAAALGALLRAVAEGEIAPAEAKTVADLIERGRKVEETAASERAAAAAAASGRATAAPKAPASPRPAADPPSSVFSSVLADRAPPTAGGGRKAALLASAAVPPLAAMPAGSAGAAPAAAVARPGAAVAA